MNLSLAGPQARLAAPSATYDVIQRIESASAAPLNLDIESYVADPVYLAAWRAWYRSWLAFNSAHTSAWSALGDLLDSSELRDTVESFRRELEDFYRTYPRELRANGQPVPPARGVVPLRATLTTTPTSAWWAWPLAVGVLGAVAYVSYRHSRARPRKSQPKSPRA